MKDSYIDKNGFALVGVLVAVVVIAALAYGGLFFWGDTKGTNNGEVNEDWGIGKTINTLEQAKEDIGGINDVLERRNDELNSENGSGSTDGWSIYRNSEFGFEFEYPSIFQTKQSSDPSWASVEVELIPRPDRGAPAQIDFIVRSDITVFDPDKIMWPASPDEMVITDIQIGRGNYDAKKVYLKIVEEDDGSGAVMGSSSEVTAYFLEINGKLFETRYFHKENGVSIEVFEEVISTLKFIN